MQDGTGTPNLDLLLSARVWQFGVHSRGFKVEIPKQTGRVGVGVRRPEAIRFAESVIAPFSVGFRLCKCERHLADEFTGVSKESVCDEQLG